MEREWSEGPPSWDETAVKAGLSLIPMVGDVALVILEDVKARRKARVQEYAQAVSDASDHSRLQDVLSSDERVADLLVAGAFAASRTSMRAKRIAMGRVVAQATEDDAQVDTLGLVMSALADLDSPHFAALGRLARVGEGHRSGAQACARTVLKPVIEALARHGTLNRAATADGALTVVGVSAFGHRLLDYVSADEPDEPKF